MKAFRAIRFVMLIVPIVLGGCKGGEQPSAGQGEKLYAIKGKVIAIEPNKPAVTLDHEDIPGLMKAMQMEFQVADEKLLQTLKPGDYVQGKLKAESGDFVITQLEKR